MFPPIPLGSGGANEIGGKYRFPGTYAVRPATLRAVFMDLAAELGEQGFRWLFIVNDHGSPDHNRMLDHAGGFFERALRVLDGWDPGQDPRYGDTLLKINPAVLGVMQRSRTRDEAMAARQRAWLAAKGLE